MRIRTLFTTVVAVALTSANLVVLAPTAGATSKTPPPQTGFTVGSIAPDLVMKTAGGKVIKLSQLRGRNVVLDLSTIWCSFSEQAAADLPSAVSQLTAPGALKAPLSWITAELEGPVEGVAPTATALADFAITHEVGDSTAPVVSFGAVGSDTYNTALSQNYKYGGANPGLPTFVALDPNGIIRGVFVGFTYNYTYPQIFNALNAVPMSVPNRPAPYAPLTPASTQLSATVNGTNATGTVTTTGATLIPGTNLAAQIDPYVPMAKDYASISTETSIADPTWFDLAVTPLPLDPSATYSLALSGMTWASKAPFATMTATSAHVAFYINDPTDPYNFPRLDTSFSITPGGTVGPFTLKQLFDAVPNFSEAEKAQWKAVAVVLVQTWTPSGVPASFGM